jgi:hypothetical protein
VISPENILIWIILFTDGSSVNGSSVNDWWQWFLRRFAHWQALFRNSIPRFQHGRHQAQDDAVESVSIGGIKLMFACTFRDRSGMVAEVPPVAEIIKCVRAASTVRDAKQLKKQAKNLSFKKDVSPTWA